MRDSRSTLRVNGGVPICRRSEGSARSNARSMPADPRATAQISERTVALTLEHQSRAAALALRRSSVRLRRPRR